MEEVSDSKPVERTVAGTQKRGVKARRSLTRALRLGCLALLVTICGSIGLLGWALQSGPVTLQLLGGSTLKFGSDDFVLSNYSFQNGTTYYIDLNGNGVRNILQLHYLEDTRRVELVLHYAEKTEQGEHRLGELALP